MLKTAVSGKIILNCLGFPGPSTGHHSLGDRKGLPTLAMQCSLWLFNLFVGLRSSLSDFVDPWIAVERVQTRCRFPTKEETPMKLTSFLQKHLFTLLTITSSSNASSPPTPIPHLSFTDRSDLCTMEKNMVYSTTGGKNSGVLQKHNQCDVESPLLEIPKQIRKRILRYAGFHREYPILL